MRFALFAPYGAPANGVMAILQLDAIAARNLVLNNRALRQSAIYARMRCRGYGRRSHEQQCADYRDVSEGNHRMLPFAQAGIIIAPVTVFSKQATAKFKSRHPDGTSAVSADEGLCRWDSRLRDYLPVAHSDCCPPDATHAWGACRSYELDLGIAANLVELSWSRWWTVLRQSVYRE
jgi:hypothetical protein